jgi:hypothetical protein
MIFSGCFTNRGYSVSSFRPVELPASMFDSKSPEDWAQLVITENISVLSFDEQRVNWQGYNEQHFIPTGRHTIRLLPSGYKNEEAAGSITYYFSSGRRYILRSQETPSHDSTIRTSTPQIDEHGVTEYAVPGRNQSLVEFTLTGVDARVNIGDKSYTLSTTSSRGRNTLRLILLNGTHQASVSSWETSDLLDEYLYNTNRNTDTQSFNVRNQFVSYTITPSYLLNKQNEQPLRFIGKWKFDLFGNGRAVMYCSFRTDNTGYVMVYEDGVPDDSGGNFKYSFTNTIISIQESGGTFSMEYTLNENELSLKNIWGLPMTVTGIRQ